MINKTELGTLSELLKQDLTRQGILLKGNPASVSSNGLWWIKLFSPRFLPVLNYRISYHLQKKKFGILARFFSMLNVLLFGIEISVQCKIGPGLFFPHTHGTVIGAVSIGDNAVIYQGVTLGAKNLDFTYNALHRPVVGNNVVIGAGAKILGGIVIEDNVIVGANSVVTKSVAINQTVVGNPAKLIKTRELTC